MERPLNVLFLCTQNAARSIMAEAILNRAGMGRFKAYSAGTNPSGQLNPHVLSLLKDMNYGTGNFRSKSWDEFTGPDAPELDFVFTVCDEAAAEPCPVWNGDAAVAHWGVPDPLKAQGSHAEIGLAYADVFRMLRNRIDLFVQLPLDRLDEAALRERLKAIGAAHPVAA